MTFRQVSGDLRERRRLIAAVPQLEDLAIQRASDDSHFGMDRLMGLAGLMSTAEAGVLAEAIFTAVDQFALSMPQEDDQTALVLRFS